MAAAFLSALLVLPVEPAGRAPKKAKPKPHRFAGSPDSHAERHKPMPRPKKKRGFEVRRVREQVPLRLRPRGRVLTRVSRTTEFGSPQTLAVAKRKRKWVGVVSSELPNGRLGWVKAAKRDTAPRRTRVSLRVDLSRRRLMLVEGKRVKRRATVGTGRPGSPTPTGRFAITDKLPGSRYSTSYGCCILALSGRQTRLPPGWTGGNRLAIHGTADPNSVRPTAGCVSVKQKELKALMRRVPLGTPVFIRR